MDKFSKICVMGLGYIGLPTAAVIASRRVKVLGVDIRPDVVATINEGKVHIVEPRLDMLVHSTITEGYLRASTTPEEADAFIIAVPTPFKQENDDDHCPDLSYVKSATQSIAPFLKKGDLVILESTSPVGSTEKVSRWLQEISPDLTLPEASDSLPDVHVAHCPERVLPGYVVRELVDNDRIVGGITPGCSKRAVQLYKIFVEGECITTDARTAEMTKLTENSFRDVNIAFANELSIICDKQGIDVWELIRLANHHPRVNILNPGPGVGGHCIAVDPWFIVSESPEESRLIRTGRVVNDLKVDWVVSSILKNIDRINRGSTDLSHIILFGLAYKADIDDLRESPSLKIALSLSKRGMRVKITDPNVPHLPKYLKEEGIELISLAEVDQYTASSLAVLLVPHKQFLNLTYKKFIATIDICGIGTTQNS
ncbi:MAG: UDP-N-acetyl-D-mannosamine dehydrogenase [Opitutae bacterium]|nr:UDP-N-acetyl-D-mannosamine dehydrogenase [Opitutae bacterium]